MRRALSITTVMILLAGCAAPQHEDAWRYQSAAATKAYGEHFLKDERVQIESNYSQAERTAKQSADLIPLARLYLSQCALNTAVLVDDPCSEFDRISDLHDDSEMKAYYAMLRGTLSSEQVRDLPSRYRSFARAYIEKEAEKIRRAVDGITPLRSRLVAASLVRHYLTDAQLDALISEASHVGYRRAVIAWMRFQMETTTDSDKKLLLERKLELLTKTR
ncbi:MAG: hypothetical protein R3302_02425 [Sulfurimonadaceae bacterium]|nr:hypothetical protein [Sulfurimonadaceae bacterium]